MIVTESRPQPSTRPDGSDRAPATTGAGRRRGRGLVALLVGLAMIVAAVGGWAAQALPAPAVGAQDPGAGGPPDVPDLPLSFVENRGQTDPEVRYVGEVGGYAVFFTPGRLVMSLGEGRDARMVLGLRFTGANAGVEPQGHAPTGAQVNYLRGDDPAGWQSGLPAYSRIVYPELWPGIDMVFQGDEGQLKYEFRVAPGADPADIRLDYDGADGLAVDDGGALLIGTALGGLRDAAPVSYQVVDGARVPVESRYVVGQGTEYGFAVGAYRPDHELVIDPALQYSTFLGGASMDRAEDMVVDAGGNVVVVGVTQSTDFPTTVGAVQPTFGGGIMDAFVAKLKPDGSGLVYATYLGGEPTPTRRGNTDNVELARSVAVDGDGNAYVTGQTDAGNFPTTSGAFQPTLEVGEQQATDGFVTKLGPTGTLVYSTFLGGELGSDDGRVIAVDGSGNAYVGGSTFAADFPTTAGAFDTTQAGGEDVFVAKLNATGSGLVYSTFLGGTDNELSHGLAVDSAGNAYVSGSTRSTDYPSTAGAFRPTHSGGEFAELFEAFVTKVGADGAALAYSTFLGGTEIDHGGEVAVGSGAEAHVLVATQSPTFPTTPGAYDTVFTGTSETAVVKLDATGSGLVYSTFLNGGGAADITLGADGSAWLGGGAGAGAPTTPDGQQNCGGGDAYVAQLDATGSGLVFATYFGGTANEGAAAIDLDTAGNIHVAGTTMSADLPTTVGAFDRVWNGDASIFWGDAFLAKFAAGAGPVGAGCPAPVLTSVSLDPTSVPGGQTSTGTVTLGAAAPEGGTSVALSSSDPAVATVPADVLIPAGALSAEFAVSTSGVPTDTSVTIFAALGGVTQTAVLTVTAPAPTVSLSSLALDPTSVTGGNPSTGTVTLTGAAPTGGASVSLVSSNTAVATVPPDVTVAEGATSATFTVSTSPQEFDASSAISASSGGVTRSVILSVAPGSGGTETTSFSGRVDDDSTVAHTVSMGAGTVEVTVNWTESRADLDLRVRNSTGTVVFSDTGSARPKTGTFSASAAGDYRFEVINSSSRNTDYTLTVTHPAVTSSPPPADTTAPAVSISSPAAGSTVSGTVSVTASATDDVGVTEVRFFVDGAQIGSDPTAPYSVSWDTTTVADGERSLTASAVDAAANSATSAPVAVTVSNTVAAPGPTVSLSAVDLSPTSVQGGNGSTGTVTLTAAAPAGGVTAALASGNTAVATVPGSVVVPEGATSATFPVSTSAVSADTTVTISATSDGVTRSATLTVTAPASTTDTVTITRAEYDADDDQLEVRASSSNASATLTVHVTATGERIGTLSSGRGTFSWPTNPQDITVRSSLGGSASSTVTAV